MATDVGYTIGLITNLVWKWLAVSLPAKAPARLGAQDCAYDGMDAHRRS